ncbi:MAG TPA: N-acetyltransferase [Pseudonocardia sp.]|nr:N-acetyltransferase [Pseudonocardia sp.]
MGTSVAVRRERAADGEAIRRVHDAAFPTALESGLMDALRADPGWLPKLSLVAVVDGVVVGHVVATRGRVDRAPAQSGGQPAALGIGPLGVHPDRQRHGVGAALMYALIGAAEALDETLLCLLGEPDYYRRFGFVTGHELGVLSPDPSWGAYFQARRLTEDAPVGAFRYAEPFSRLD